MVTIAIYNIKGGVGKTAGCVNLAYLAAEDGKRTLVWDLDPQGAASFYFEQEQKLRGGFKKLLANEVPMQHHIVNTGFEGLDILPADMGNKEMDIIVDEAKQAKKRFRSLVGQLQGHYDYLFIDCPPGMGPLAEAIFAASDYVVLPTIPTTLSMRTYDMLIQHFEDKQLDSSRLLAFFSMVDARKSMHNDMLEKQQRNKHFLKSYIPYLSTVEKMGTRMAPVAWFAPSSYAAQCFRDVWKELKRKIT